MPKLVGVEPAPSYTVLEKWKSAPHAYKQAAANAEVLGLTVHEKETLPFPPPRAPAEADPKRKIMAVCKWKEISEFAWYCVVIVRADIPGEVEGS